MEKKHKESRHSHGERKARPKFKRKKKLINPSFQLRYMSYIVGLMMLSFFVIFGCFYLGIWDGILEGLSMDTLEEQKQFEDMKKEPWLLQKSEVAMSMYFQDEEGLLSDSQKQVFEQIFTKTNEKLLPAFFLYLIVVVVVARLITFRIAGPLFRVQADINYVLKGKLAKRVMLRKGDQCREVADHVNSLIENFDFTIENFKKVTRDYDDDPERMMKALRAQLDRFETSGDVSRRHDEERGGESSRSAFI